MEFFNPSRGKLSFEETFQELVGYISKRPRERYQLIIGTDSQTHLNKDVQFVTAIVIHRVGKGGRYFFRRDKLSYIESLRQRIYFETSMSLEVASRLTARLAENGYSHLDIEIHLDVGENGETKDIIREVVGMVIGSGYDARIKPDSYGATKVADKYTK